MAITREADRRDANWQVECAYTALSALLDDCLAEAARSIECGVRGDEAPDLFQYLSLALPAGFFAAPFFSTLRLLHRNRELNDALLESFGVCGVARGHARAVVLGYGRRSERGFRHDD